MYNIGLLGASNIAPMAIIEPARNITGAVVRAVAARDISKAEIYARDHGIPEAYDDYDALINSPEIDIVYVGLPPSHHAYWSIRALQAGKHVICEKPIAMNTKQAKLMVAAADASTGRLIEAMHTRYHPSFEVCLDWVRSGKIGDVVTMVSHFGVPLEDDGKRNQFRAELGGGSVMDMGCYPLQWVDSFAGGHVKSVAAQAVMSKSGVDESMKATLTFDNGAVANIACSMAGPGKFSADLKITGTQGEIAFSDPLVPHSDGTLALTYADGSVLQHDVSKISTYQYQLQRVVEGLQSGASLPTEGEAIIRQQQLIDEVYAAAGLGALRQGETDMTVSP